MLVCHFAARKVFSPRNRSKSENNRVMVLYSALPMDTLRQAGILNDLTLRA